MMRAFFSFFKREIQFLVGYLLVKSRYRSSLRSLSHAEMSFIYDLFRLWKYSAWLSDKKNDNWKMRQQENRVAAALGELVDWQLWWHLSLHGRWQEQKLWPQLLSSLDGLFVNNNIFQTSFYSCGWRRRRFQIDGGMSQWNASWNWICFETIFIFFPLGPTFLLLG